MHCGYAAGLIQHQPVLLLKQVVLILFPTPSPSHLPSYSLYFRFFLLCQEQHCGWAR